MNPDHESAALTYSSDDSVNARQTLFQMLLEYPATESERERSLGLFIRGSLLARFLAIRDLYELILDRPGIVIDLGTWRGQTAVICENLRAIYEPLNFTRRVICFDTFDGYAGFGEKDRPTELHGEGTYAVGGAGYADYLARLLELHERSNAMGHNHGKHSVIAGDCRTTLPKYFEEQNSSMVALAFFDLNAFEPTLHAFREVWARLIPGGVVAFWQLTRDVTPAEGRVYAEEILGRYRHTIHRCSTYPGLCYLVKGE